MHPGWDPNRKSQQIENFPEMLVVGWDPRSGNGILGRNGIPGGILPGNFWFRNLTFSQLV